MAVELLGRSAVVALLLLGGAAPARAEHAGPNREPRLEPIAAVLSPPVTRYRVRASDPDGDPLAYTWTLTSPTEPEACVARFFQEHPDPDVAVWSHGDDTPCSHLSPIHLGTVRVEVNDGHDHVAISSYEGGSASGTGRILATFFPSLDPDVGLITGPSPTLIEDEFPETTVRFSFEDYQVEENAGFATITVNREGSARGAVSVSYDVRAFTASPGRHYIATSGTLRWEDGDLLPKTFPVVIIDNDSLSGTPEVRLALTDSVGAQIDTPHEAILRILDDEERSCTETLTLESIEVLHDTESGQEEWTIVTRTDRLGPSTVSVRANAGAGAVRIDHRVGSFTQPKDDYPRVTFIGVSITELDPVFDDLGFNTSMGHRLSCPDSLGMSILVFGDVLGELGGFFSTSLHYRWDVTVGFDEE